MGVPCGGSFSRGKETGPAGLHSGVGSFLSEMFVDRGLSFANIKVYAAAIHNGFGDRTVFSHLLLIALTVAKTVCELFFF